MRPWEMTKQEKELIDLTKSSGKIVAEEEEQR